MSQTVSRTQIYKGQEWKYHSRQVKTQPATMSQTVSWMKDVWITCPCNSVTIDASATIIKLFITVVKTWKLVDK